MDAFYSFTLMAFGIFFLIASLGAFVNGLYGLGFELLAFAVALFLVRKL